MWYGYNTQKFNKLYFWKKVTVDCLHHHHQGQLMDKFNVK